MGRSWDRRVERVGVGHLQRDSIDEGEGYFQGQHCAPSFICKRLEPQRGKRQTMSKERGKSQKDNREVVDDEKGRMSPIEPFFCFCFEHTAKVKES